MEKNLGPINEKEEKVLTSLVDSHNKTKTYGFTDVAVEGFTKMQVGAYVTILSNKGWIKIQKKIKGEQAKRFEFSDVAKTSLKDLLV